MIVILDTNIIRSDFFLSSGNFVILRDYMLKTRSKFVLPTIVFDELAAVYEREVRKLQNELLVAIKKLSRVAPDMPALQVDLDVGKTIESYLSSIRKNMNIADNDIVDYKDSYLRDVVERAIRRRRPCSDRGEEMRDAILWHTVLDVAENSADKAVIFISNNHKQFAVNNSELHHELQEECDKRGINIRYFTSLEAFAKEHAVHIDFITSNWLLESLGVQNILSAGKSEIFSSARWAVEHGEFEIHNRNYVSNAKSTGYFARTSYHDVRISGFYVYEMTDGSYRVEATLIGEVEVECEVEVEVEEEYPDFVARYDPFTHDVDMVESTRTRHRFSTEYVSVVPEIDLDLEIVIRDQKVESWKVTHEHILRAIGGGIVLTGGSVMLTHNSVTGEVINES